MAHRMNFLSKSKRGKQGEARAPSPQADSALGLDVLFNGEDSNVDIVAVHGLNGHREKTWSTASGFNWLRHLLPTDLPGSRILSYGYNSRTHGSDHLAVQPLHEHAIALIQMLCAYRRNTKTERRPIVFLAHSLGGILVKSALIHSNLSKSSEHSIKTSTIGVIFFGTPHTGSSAAALATLALGIGSIFTRTNTAVIRHLRENSEWLRMQIEQFNHSSAGIQLAFFYETYKTKVLLGREILIVPPHSASLPGNPTNLRCALRKTHTELVRFENRSDPDYLVVSDCLQGMISQSSHIAPANWKMSEASSISTGGFGSIKLEGSSQQVASMHLSFSLPVHQTHSFVGRDNQLKQLHEYLCKDAKAVGDLNPKATVVVLHGLGGVGKTQLSLAYAHSHRREFNAVLWVDGSSQRNVLLSYQAIAQRFMDTTRQTMDQSDGRGARSALLSRLLIGEHMSATGMVSTDAEALPKIAAAVVDFLQSEEETFTWLLIMDNVDNVADYPLSNCLPLNGRGNIIITTRLTALARFGHALEVGQLDEESGVQMLLNAACLRMKGSTDDEDAKAIANAVGFLPLALEQAGSYISQTQMQLRNYMHLFEKHKGEFLSSPKGLVPGSANQLSVFATWELSFQRLEQEHHDAAELLTLLAFLDRSTFWEGLLTRHPSVPKAEELRPSGDRFSWLMEFSSNELKQASALGSIFSVSLAKRGGPDGSVYVHPLVHSWGRDRASRETRSQKLAEAVVVVGTALEQAYKTSSPQEMSKEARDFVSRVVPHADHCVGLLYQEGITETLTAILADRTAGNALFYMGILFQNTARLKEAEDIFAAIAARREDKTSPCTPLMIANAQRRLAHVLVIFSRYQEAEEILLQSVPSLTKLAGEHHPDTLAALLELGTVHHRCFRYQEAERFLRQVMENDVDVSSGGIQTMGPVGREAASVLGLVYKHLGRLENALSMLRIVIDQASGKEHDGETAHLLILKYRHAIILQEMGDWAKALQAYLEVHEGFKTVLGPGHPWTLRSANAMGRLYCQLGRYREARDMLDRAWAGQEALGLSREKETAQLRTLFNIGVLNREEGLYAEAHDCLDRALRAEERLHGPHAYSTVRCRFQLAAVQGAKGDLAEAARSLRDVLSTQLTHYPDNAMGQTQTRALLGETLVRLGSLEQARDALAPALEFVRSSLEVDHPLRLETELAFAGQLVACGRGREISPDLKEVLARLDSTLGPHHPTSIRGRVILAEMDENRTSTS